jgi:hypothetical protein
MGGLGSHRLPSHEHLVTTGARPLGAAAHDPQPPTLAGGPGPGRRRAGLCVGSGSGNPIPTKAGATWTRSSAGKAGFTGNGPLSNGHRGKSHNRGARTGRRGGNPRKVGLVQNQVTATLRFCAECCANQPPPPRFVTFSARILNYPGRCQTVPFGCHFVAPNIKIQMAPISPGGAWAWRR